MDLDSIDHITDSERGVLVGVAPVLAADAAVARAMMPGNDGIWGASDEYLMDTSVSLLSQDHSSPDLSSSCGYFGAIDDMHSTSQEDPDAYMLTNSVLQSPYRFAVCDGRLQVPSVPDVALTADQNDPGPHNTTEDVAEHVGGWHSPMPIPDVTLNEARDYLSATAPTVEQILIETHPLYPALKATIERVRCTLLGVPYPGAATPIDSEIARLLQNQAVHTDIEVTANEVTTFMLRAIGVYRALLFSLIQSQAGTCAQWAAARARLQTGLASPGTLALPAPPTPPESVESSDDSVETHHKPGRYSGRSSRDWPARARSNPYRKRRSTLPEQATAHLKRWLFDHTDKPYPDDDEKDELILATGLNVSQINNWFINARRRMLPNSTRHSPASG